MGRLNRRLASAKKLKAENVSLSASTLAKTLAAKDQKELLKVTPEVQRSVHFKKSSQASKITKKDKMKFRKDHLKQRLEVMQIIKKEEKAALKRKQKYAIIGDIKPITDTLDTLLAEDEAKKKDKKRLIKTTNKPMKQKKVKEQIMKDLAIFQQVLKHPQYNQDPLGTISTHIENKMLLESSMGSS